MPRQFPRDGRGRQIRSFIGHPSGVTEYVATLRPLTRVQRRRCSRSELLGRSRRRWSSKTASPSSRRRYFARVFAAEWRCWSTKQRCPSPHADQPHHEQGRCLRLTESDDSEHSGSQPLVPAHAETPARPRRRTCRTATQRRDDPRTAESSRPHRPGTPSSRRRHPTRQGCGLLRSANQ